MAFFFILLLCAVCTFGSDARVTLEKHELKNPQKHLSLFFETNLELQLQMNSSKEELDKSVQIFKELLGPRLQEALEKLQKEQRVIFFVILTSVEVI